jgi:rhodanese-related sulfurtransferase
VSHFFRLDAPASKAETQAMKNLLIAIALAGAGLSAIHAAEPVIAGPAAVETWIKNNPGAIIVDVRTREEYAGGCLDKAVRVEWPDKDFTKEVAAKLDSSKPVLVYCRSGGRSAGAAEELVKLGFKKVCDLEGGILAWKKAGKPVVTPEPGKRP